MYEVSCAACAASFEYNVDDYIHLCPYCSSGFVLDLDEGAKDLISDHFIIPNRLDRASVEKIFYSWIADRYHRSDRVEKEFKIIGAYGMCIPFWVVSLEAHTFWSGHSRKTHKAGPAPDYNQMFVKEEGRFSRRYRWAILARKSPKEHWGIERLHNPQENVIVDWDGFPLDESMGKPVDNVAPIYESKRSFKFEHANGLTIAGIQVKESSAIARAKDQVQEYHRRICKTKVDTLFEHRTEIEVVGIQIAHVPFWVLRYAFVPQSIFKFLTTARERRLVIQGYTENVLEAEMPLNSSDKVMTNLVVCGVAGFISLILSVFLSPLFFVLTAAFAIISILSAWRLTLRERAKNSQEDVMNDATPIKSPL